MPQYSKIVRRRPASYIFFGPGGQASLGPTVDGSGVAAPAAGGEDDTPQFVPPSAGGIGYGQQIALAPTAVVQASTMAASTPIRTTPIQAVASAPVQTSVAMQTVAAPPATSIAVITSVTSIQEAPQALSTPVRILRSTIVPTQAAPSPITSVAIAVASPNSSISSSSPSTTSSLVAPTSTQDATASESSVHSVPVILGIIVACVVGFAALAASLSWILRMRRKEGGFCGCFGRQRPPEEGIEKWVYDDHYVEPTPDAFKEKDAQFSSDRKEDSDHGWSKITTSSLGTYPATPHPAALYAGLGPPYGQYPSPLQQQSPYVPRHDSLRESPFFLDRPAVAHVVHEDPFPSIAQPHDASPIQPAPTPGLLTIANFTPGDISDGTSRAESQPGAHSPWMLSSPNVAMPQRPWTSAFSPYSNVERFGAHPPLSPLPETFGTPRERNTPPFFAVQGEDLPLPWAPLNVGSKSGSSRGSDSRKSSMRSAYSNAPRLPTPTSMSGAGTSHSDGGWAATLKSNIFAALGAVSNMGSSSSQFDGIVPPSAPLNDRLTPTISRGSSSRSSRSGRGPGTSRKGSTLAGIAEDEEDTGGRRRSSRRKGTRTGAPVMTVVSSEESYVEQSRPRRVRSNGSKKDNDASRLWQTVREDAYQHEDDMRRFSGGAVQPCRSISVYSSSTGYTTDRGQDNDLESGNNDILKMYSGQTEMGGGGNESDAAVNRQMSYMVRRTGRRSRRVAAT